MLKEKWFNNDKILLPLLILLSAAARIIFLLKFDNMPGDAADHVVKALSILNNPSFLFNFDGNSSTLYKYALASFMHFWRDPVIAPRVFTALFGILLVVPYYGALKILFDRRVAFFSTLMLVFYPLHLVQSSTTTSEAVYYFFLFGSFYYLFSYKIIRERFSALLLSALSFNIASLLRFESWIFIPIFFLLLWPRGKRTAFLFLILLMVFPCAHLMLNQIVHHDFIFSFNAPSRTMLAEISIGRRSYDPRFWSWLNVLWRSSGPGLVIGGLSGIVLAFLTRQKRQMAVFFLVLLSALTVNTLSSKIGTNSRYSIILGLFLIPYAWFFVGGMLAFLRLGRMTFFILILSFLAFNSMQTLRKDIPRTTEMICLAPPEIKNIAAWLKEHVRAHESLVLEGDPHDVFPANILIRSGIASRKYKIIFKPPFGKKDFENGKEFERYIWRRRTNYLVLNSGNSFQKMLNLDLSKKYQDFGGAVFERVFEESVPMSGKFIIYKISYPEFSGSGGDA